jgi:hypothetical protein
LRMTTWFYYGQMQLPDALPGDNIPIQGGVFLLKPRSAFSKGVDVFPPAPLLSMWYAIVTLLPLRLRRRIHLLKDGFRSIGQVGCAQSVDRL